MSFFEIPAPFSVKPQGVILTVSDIDKRLVGTDFFINVDFYFRLQGGFDFSKDGDVKSFNDNCYQQYKAIKHPAIEKLDQQNFIKESIENASNHLKMLRAIISCDKSFVMELKITHTENYKHPDVLESFAVIKSKDVVACSCGFTTKIIRE